MLEVVPYIDRNSPKPAEEVSVESPIEAVVEEATPVENVKEPATAGPKEKNYEEEARGKGWKPKEEFAGDPEDWAPAKAWLKTGEILDTLHSVKKQAKENQDALEALAKHNSEIERKTYERAYREAEDRQRAAAEVGDVTGVQKTTKELMELAPKVGSTPKPQNPSSLPEVDDFIVQNRDWFNQSTPENTAMMAYAVSMSNEVEVKHKTLTNHQKLSLVKDSVKKAFPHRFDSSEPFVDKAVLPSDSVKKTTKIDDFSKLPDHHKKLYMKLQRDFGKRFDGATYIKNCKLIGELN